MKIQVRAQVAGSNAAVATGEFKFHLVSDTQVETCAETKLEMTAELAYDQTLTRPSELVYWIAMIDESTPDPLEIAAYYVFSNKDKELCPTVTIAQYYDPWELMWKDVRDDEYNTLYMEDQDDLYFEFGSTQQQYLEDLAWKFADYNDPMTATGMPKNVTIQGRFLTWAVNDYSTLLEDKFEVVVVGTDETEVDFCATDFEDYLTITGEMSDRSY